MWINQLTVFSLEFAEPSTWGDLFARCQVDSPAIGQTKAIGFLPLQYGATYVDSLDRHHAFLGAQTERKVPRDAIDREVRRRFKGESADEGEAKAAYAQVASELNDGAPVREKSVPAVYDDYTKRLFVFAPPSAAEDIVLAAMRQALGSLHAFPTTLSEAPQPKLTRWLAEGRAPEPFLIGRNAELQADESEAGKTTFKDQDLSGEIIRQHVERGDEVTSLQLNWRGQLEFTVNSKGEIRKIAPPECTMKPQHAMNIWPDIMDKLPQFYEDVLALLGGARDINAPLEVKEREKSGKGKAAAEPARPPGIPAPPVEDGEAIAETVTPVQDGGLCLGIVAEGARDQAVAFVTALDQLLAKRPTLSEILVPTIKNDLMRRAFAWGKENGLKVSIVDARNEEDRRRLLFDKKPRGILLYGTGNEVSATDDWAKARQVPVMRLSGAK